MLISFLPGCTDRQTQQEVKLFVVQILFPHLCLDKQKPLWNPVWPHLHHHEKNQCLIPNAYLLQLPPAHVFMCWDFEETWNEKVLFSYSQNKDNKGTIIIKQTCIS